MKKIYFIFLIFIISCNSNKKIEGTWIKCFYCSKSNPKSLNKFPTRGVLTLKNNKFIYSDFKYDFISDTNNIKGFYKYRFNILELKYQNELEKKHIISDKDSLVIKNSLNTYTTYYKIPDSLKTNSIREFIGKNFIFNTIKHRDTVHFLNDSIINYKGNDFNENMYWQRTNHDGFDVIFFESAPPLIVDYSNEDKIRLKGFCNDGNIELKEIK